MDAQNALETLISEIKAETGVDLAFDENGMTVLQHESEVAVILTADYASGLMRINTLLGSIADANREELLGDLMVVNFFPQVYGPFFFALNPEQTHLFLMSRTPILSLDAHGLIDHCNQLVRAHQILSELLVGPLSGRGRLSQAIAERFDDAESGAKSDVPATFV
ncbi:MAG: type III secretion system chaperone [Pseudomonadota bacterium]